MMNPKLVAVAALLAAVVPIRPVLADTPKSPTGAPIPVPSGAEVRWLETVSDMQGPDGLTLRFRFVSPGLGKGNTASETAVAKDMQTLCDSYALKRLPNQGPKPSQIVIALADKVFPYGAATPGVKQFFEAYSIENGRCKLELF